MSHKAIFAAVGLALTAAAGVARAEDSGTLEEVVITAEKRASDPMTTAVAVDALSGSALQDRQVTNLEQLTAATPSFTFAPQGPTSAVNIRGIGLSVSSPNVAPGVPLYRDGLLAPTLLPNEPFLDIGDVEVLRGPQGTLVGGNSTGGAVFINTRNPDLAATGGSVRVEAGSYDRLSAQGVYNLPVSESIALRGAVYGLREDSPWTDLQPSSANHPAPGATNQLAARFSLLYQPNDKFSILWKTNYQDDQNGGMAHVPQAGTNAAVGYPTSRYTISYADPDTQYSDFQIRTGLTINYKFDNGIAFKSVTGDFYTYEYYHDQQYVDPTPTSFASAPFINQINDHVWSQEFNLVSPADARLHWVLGNFNQYWPAHIKLNPNTPAVVVDEGTLKQSYALYGEAGFDFTSRLELHAGVRGTIDRASGSGGVYLIPAGHLQLAPNDVSQSDHLFTGRLGLNFKLAPTQFLYAFVAKGAKTGGVNGTGVPNFAPETVFDYEAGLKSSWLEGHLNTEVGAFYMDYRDMQLSVVAPAAGRAPQGSIANVGKSTIQGVEGSLQARAAALELDANVSYVKSKVSSPPLLNSYLYQAQGLTPTGAQCAPGQTTGCFDFTPYYQSSDGVADPYSPKSGVNVGVSYEIALPNAALLKPRVDYSYTAEQWATVFQNSVDLLQSRRLLNLSLAFVKSRWTVTAYGSNVTRDYYVTGQTGAQNFYGDPAKYGIRFEETF